MCKQQRETDRLRKEDEQTAKRDTDRLERKMTNNKENRHEEKRR
jgi:hypothetical protein